MNATKITVKTTINGPVEKVWQLWTTPEEITKWNSPSPEWHTPRASHKLVPGGEFLYRMEARDGSAGFDFNGTFDTVQPQKHLAYTLADGRKVSIDFTSIENNKTLVNQTFDAENENSIEMQRAGWQAILDNFRKYVEQRVAAKG